MKSNLQINLYKHRNDIRSLSSPIRLGSSRFKYLKTFLKTNKSLLRKAFIFLIIQIIIEIIILLLINNTSKNIVSKIGYFDYKSSAFIIIGFCLLYTIVTFIAIKYERMSVLRLINNLRKMMFRNNLKEEDFKNDTENKSNLIAKVSYHLSVLNMGIDNTLLSSIRWAVYMMILVTFSIINKESYLYITGLVFISSILLFFISYFFSNVYISRQAASYSKIIRHITTSILEMPFIKGFHREKIEEEKLDNIVEIDTYFRIKRDTWIRYLSRIVFILIISFSSIYSLLKNSYPSLSIDISSQLIFKSIFYFYIIRILYTSVRAGLYFLPLKLGIFLSIPDKIESSISPRGKWSWETISFRSNKIKLFKESNYYKDVSLEFKKGFRYLFFGDYRIGKTHLASLLAGYGYFSRHSWFVKVDKENFGYNYWSEIFKENYLFSPSFYTNSTIGEIILNKEKEDINQEDMQLINTISNKYPLFDSIFSKTRFIGESAKRFISSPVSLFKIQTAYCLLNKPKLIIIDNMWIDLNYKEIEDLIKILEKELPLSIIILFSRNKNSILEYNTIYEIQKTSFKKI